MSTYVFLFAIIVLPLILGVVLRVGAPHLFFSLMAGELLARYFGHETDFFNLGGSSKLLDPIILLAPIFLTAILLRKTIQGSKLLLHIVPLVITGFILAVFLLPIIPLSWQNLASQNQLGEVILSFNAPIVGVIVVMQLIYLWVISHREKIRGEKA